MDLKSQYAHRSDDGSLVAFLAHRGRLFGIAYRMLGSSFDAEDVVQETWIRWHGCDRTKVRDPAAFLTTTTTRLAINVLTSAHSRRETYAEPWLPEPVDTSHDPTLGAERGEALEYAVLLLMERLNPMERAAYVLREAFAYPYSRIAEILHTTEAHSRQLVCRARRRLAAPEVRTPSGSGQRRAFLARFLDAASGRDARALERLLADAATGRPATDDTTSDHTTSHDTTSDEPAAEGSMPIKSDTRFSVLDSRRERSTRVPRRIAG